MNPFIIWTVQRTGGTNFATNLIKLSGLPIIEHEPLNAGRSYGHISRNWIETHDKSELDKSIEDLLEKKGPIKHCVENVDWEINKSLISKSTSRNFFHIVLYREKSIDRLLSLHFALETGLWGRKKVSTIKNELGNEFKNSLSIRKIDVEGLFKHEEYCTITIMNSVRELKKKSNMVYAVSFEDLYETPHPVAEQKISILLRNIGIADHKILEDFVKRIQEVGDQGSKLFYKDIEGYEALKEKISASKSLRKQILHEFPEIII